MSEMVRPRHRDDDEPGPAGIGSMFGAGSGRGGTATVCHGIHYEELPVANMTVGDIRARFGARFDIDPQSEAVLDRRDVDDRAVVKAGQTLTFVRRAGEKGCA